MASGSLRAKPMTADSVLREKIVEQSGCDGPGTRPNEKEKYMTRLTPGSVWCAALIAAVLTLISPAAAGEPTKRRRPNVVVIVADDLGYGDLGFQGCKDIPTPHFDALAASGARFRSAYVTGPICGPSRAAIMSGRYQQRHSYDGNPGPKEGLSLKEVTLAVAQGRQV